MKYGTLRNGNLGEGATMKIDRHTRTTADLRAELDAFEHQYGVETVRLEQAFLTREHLDETDDYQRWSLLRSAYRRLQERQGCPA